MSMGVTGPEGIGIFLPPGADIRHIEYQVTRFLLRLGSIGWCRFETLKTATGQVMRLRLRKSLFAKFSPGFDTLALRQRLLKSIALEDEQVLLREIWVAMLSAPVRMDFANLDELDSHLRIRCNIVRAAEKTSLAFKTHAAERPTDFWNDEPEEGFLLKPEVCLVDALIATTQPERTGRLYDFSCYRATEYVILLGLAQEARSTAPDLYACLEAKARQKCIKSGLFHEVFLIEYGITDAPIPMHYYVPGDRVWFKNPDEHSSNAPGYEGSWVIYLGGGHFSNFWKRNAPYSMEAKAMEIYHWRHGVFIDPDAGLQMNELKVEAEVARTRSNPIKRQKILRLMNRYRDPTGIYSDGGCIDASREFPRQLKSIVLP